MDSSTVFFVSIASLIIFTIVTFVSTGSILATLIVVLILAMVIVVLSQMGYLTIDFTKDTLDFGYHETAPSPSNPSKKESKPLNMEMSEVFYIGGNDYIYDEAAAVCAAYDSRLATYDEIATAFAAGAEWCGYGWTQGGMALFPTQESTWADMQLDVASRTKCGRPGINGGYFDPATKFGVNCYGVKPKDHGTKFPLPIPGTDTNEFNKMVNKFKSMLKHMPVNPFNRVGWSEWNAKSHEPSSISSAINDVQSYI